MTLTALCERFIDATHYTTRVYVTPPNDGYKKADF